MATLVGDSLRVGEPVALQPGGLGAGRPAAGRPAPRDLRANIFAKVFSQKPLPPRSGAAGVYSCKFRKRKYIFLKNENKK